MGDRGPELIESTPGTEIENKLSTLDNTKTGCDKINIELPEHSCGIDCSNIPPEFRDSFLSKWQHYRKIRNRVFHESATVGNGKACSERILKTRQRHRELRAEHKRIISSMVGGNKADSRPYAQIILWGKAMSGLLDSGASISVLGAGALQLLRDNGISYRLLKSSLKVANGTALPVFGKFQTNIAYRDRTETIMLYIAPDLSQKLYLGFDF